MTELAFPKPRPHMLEKREQKAKRAAIDRRERKVCRLRSGGRCEIITAHFKPESSAITYERCKGRVTQNHHLIGGTGRRNLGKSIYAEFRLDVCATCHAEINARILVPMFSDEAFAHHADKVRYERRTL